MEGMDTFLIKDEKEIELRKCREIMHNTGIAVVMFAAWNLLKTIMTVFLDTPVHQYIKDIVDTTIEMVIFVTLIFIIVLIDLLIRLYVGRSIIREADKPPMTGVNKSGKVIIKGRKRLNAAIGLLMVISFAGIANLVPGNEVITSRLDIIVSTFIDLTLLAILIRMSVATHRMRKLRAVSRN